MGWDGMDGMGLTWHGLGWDGNGMVVCFVLLSCGVFLCCDLCSVVMGCGLFCRVVLCYVVLW